MQIFPIIPHDLLPGYVANEHIDWTNAGDDLATTGTLKVGDNSTGFNRSIKTGDGNGTDNSGTYIEFPSSASEGYGAQIGGIRTAYGGENALIIKTGTNAQSERFRVDDNGYITINQRLRIGDAVAPADRFELAFTTEDVDFVDAGSVGATEQDWIEVKVGNNTGYIRVYAGK